MAEYIKREDVMERVGRWQLNTREAIAEMIMSVPSADVVERKRGKWDTFFSDSYKVHKIGVECSCCGYRTQERTNYCPHCGADMRGREDG